MSFIWLIQVTMSVTFLKGCLHLQTNDFERDLVKKLEFFFSLTKIVWCVFSYMPKNMLINLYPWWSEADMGDL